MSASMIPFIDLKTQYQALKPQIQERIERGLEHGQFNLGPEVRDLESLGYIAFACPLALLDEG